MARERTIHTKSWLGVTTPSGVTLTGTQGAIVSIGIAESAIRETLLRTRGNILIQGTPDAAGDVEVVGLGLIVVHSNAVTAGGLALPGPIEDDGADWLWHQYVPLDAITLTSADPNARSVVVRVEVDAKAMRRVPSDHEVVLMGELSTTSFASVTALAGIRMLFGH